MNHELHGLDDYLTRANDDLPSGDGSKVKPLMLTCQTCGWRGPVSDAAQPCIDAGHKLTGRNGQVQQFSESWRTKPLSTTPLSEMDQRIADEIYAQHYGEALPVYTKNFTAGTAKLARCASCDDDCTGAVYQYVAGEATCCDACARAVLASLEAGMITTEVALTLAMAHLRDREDALSEAMGEVERRIAQLVRKADDDFIADLKAERAVIAKVLMTFYCAPVSMSSIQPLLELAEALNPAMVKVPRAWRPFVADQP